MRYTENLICKVVMIYSAGMELPLPTGNYRWLTVDEIKDMDLLSIDPDGDTCYILEVDLAYPRDP